MKKSPRSSKRYRVKSTIVVRRGVVHFQKRDGCVLPPVDDVYYGVLTDPVWEKISALTPLANDARFHIAAAITTYRHIISTDRVPLATKRRVIRMRGAIRKLLKDAASLKSDPIFFNASIPFWTSRSGPNVDDIASRIQSIVELDQILVDAQDRLRMKRGRKSADHLTTLVHFLGSIQADVSGIYVKRSTKAGSLRATNRFITFCVKLADPNIPNSSIENTLTKCISQHRKMLREEGFNTATGRYVDDVD